MIYDGQLNATQDILSTVLLLPRLGEMEVAGPQEDCYAKLVGHQQLFFRSKQFLKCLLKKNIANCFYIVAKHKTKPGNHQQHNLEETVLITTNKIIKQSSLYKKYIILQIW